MSDNAITHTPGPWVISSNPDDFNNPHHDDKGWAIVGTVREEEWVIAEVCSDVGMAEEDRSEGEANARLIAAAPELFAAVQRIVASPFGCRFCDSGKLRTENDPAKYHAADCGFMLARNAMTKVLPDQVPIGG